jgi:hypothetical protein
MSLLDGIILESGSGDRQTRRHRFMRRIALDWPSLVAPRRRRQEGEIEAEQMAYPTKLARVVPPDGAVAVVAGEIMPLLPEPPTPPWRSHRLIEPGQ